MKPQSRTKKATIIQEMPDHAPAGWAEVQTSLAAESGLSLLLVEGDQPPALTVSNNNSICQALQSSPDYVKLCGPYCGVAHQRATEAGTVTHYRCHAGLHCFAMPVQIQGRDLAVIGGRALLTSGDYRALAERFRTGDLQELISPELFSNVIFADEADLDHTALRVAAAAGEFVPGEGSKNAGHFPTADELSAAVLADEIERELARIRAELQPAAKETATAEREREVEEELAPVKTRPEPLVEESESAALFRQVEEELARVRAQLEPKVESPVVLKPTPVASPIVLEPLPVVSVPDIRSSVSGSIHGFIERLDASDPARAYELILSESADLLNAERGSLLLYDEAADNLALKATRGIPIGISDVGRIPLGQGIASSVLREGRAIVTTDIMTLGRSPAPRERGYKTKSFLSYPIRIGERKIGVLNLTDKSGGGSYDEIDLKIIESVGPQIALAVERAEWQEKAQQFQLQSLIDPLTDLHNRRYLEARLTEEVTRAKRHGHATSFMMIDIDDFKFYNDHNGHQAGDQALRVTAQCLVSAVRSIDVAARYGGEEFSILMPETDLKEASVIADRIRRKIADGQFSQGDRQPLGAVTVSIGLASFSSTLDSPEKIVRAADRALYHAKRQGKNRAYAYRDTAAGSASQ